MPNRNERGMPELPSLEDFLRRMDAGDFDGNLHIELKKFSKEQLSELADILLKRSTERRKRAATN